MMEIPIIDGEEWWSSSAIDDTDNILRLFISLLDSCIKAQINVERSNILLSKISSCSDQGFSRLNVEEWIDFCVHLSDTNLSKEASQMRDELEKFTHKHLPSKGFI